MVFYRHINTALVSCFASISFAYLTRMFPEKMVLLLLLRFSIVAGLACFWQYDPDNRSLYTFLLIGLNVGFLVGYWDEFLLNFTVYPETTFFFVMSALFFLTGVSLYVVQTKNKSEKS